MGAGWSSIHPLPAFLYYAALLGLSMLLLHPIYLLTAVAWTLWLWNMTDKKGISPKKIGYYVLTGAVIAMANPLFTHRGATILFYMLDQPVTLESVVYGFLMMLSLLAILFAFQSYQLVMTGEKTMVLFARMAPRTTLVIRMAMRFVPLLLRRFKQVYDVQRTQGMSQGRRSLRRKARDGMQLVSILLTWSLEEAIISARSMRARGYGLHRRTNYTRYRMRRGDWILLIAIAVTVGVILIGKYVGYATFETYPRLGTIAFADYEWAVYFAYCSFLLIPLYLEGKEWYSWRWWRSTNSPLPTPMPRGRR